MRLLLLFIFIFTISQYSLAQDSRATGSASGDIKVRAYSADEILAIRQALMEHPYTRYYDRLIVEYEQRMKANIKKYKIMARKMRKPQYSDPLYFGHKRKPKKRPVGKRKYCKECELVH